MRFKGLALQMLARGIAVIPLKPCSKVPACSNGARDASLDPAQVEAWDQERPNANCASVAQPDGVWMLDSDDEPALLEAVGQPALPETFTVMATRGPHLYFRQNEISRAMGNVVVAGIAEARVHNQYCISPDSVHPSGKHYRIAKDLPIIEAPAWLTDWLLASKSATSVTKGVPGVPNPSSVQEALVWFHTVAERWEVPLLAPPVPQPEGGYHIYVACPQRHLHTEDSGITESAVIIMPDGPFVYRCMHAHCTDFRWAQFRAHYDVVTDEQLEAFGCVEEGSSAAPGAPPQDSAEDHDPSTPPSRKPTGREFPLTGLYGPLGAMARKLNVPLGLAYPLLITAYGFHVPETPSIRANVYCLAMAPPGAGKDEAAESALKAVKTPSIRVTLASDRGMEKAIGGGGRVMFYLSEFITTLRKAMIQNSGLPGLLCKLHSVDDFGTADKFDATPLKARVSLIGNIVVNTATHFSALMDQTVTGGLYDRLLLASPDPDEPSFDYLPPSLLGLDDFPDLPPVTVMVSLDWFHKMNHWKHAREKEFPGLSLGRVAQNLMKIAMITCSANGETEMSQAAFDAAAAISLWQCHLRRYYQPSNATNPGAQIAVLVEGRLLELAGKYIKRPRLAKELRTALGCNPQEIKTMVEAMVWSGEIVYDKDVDAYAIPKKVPQ
jgi:hypothetical protein